MGKEVKKMKEGDTVVIDGIIYRFDKGASEAFNFWLDFLEPSAVDTDAEIRLLEANRRGGELFSPSRIKEALERAEMEDWNKTPHGI